MQEDQIKKLEEFKHKYQILQGDLEEKQRHIDRLEKLGSGTTKKEEENNIRLLHQLKKAHETIEEMKRVIEKADKKIKAYKRQIDELKKEQQENVKILPVPT